MVLTLIGYLVWNDGRPSELALSTIPNLLGFTIGALAIVLAFSSSHIFKTLAEHGAPDSFFVKLTANLVHFVVVQVLTLLTATIAKLANNSFLEVISLFFLLYAVLVALAAGLQLFITAIIYNAAQK